MDEEKLRSLEKDLKKEKERADKSEQEYFTLKVFYFCLINIFGYDRFIKRLNLMIMHKVNFYHACLSDANKKTSSECQ